MVLGKQYRVYHKTDQNKIYSVLLENKNDRSETLVFESGAIGILTTQETENVKSLYRILEDVYGCLGVLNISVENQNFLYLVCISSCVSIGKISNFEVFCVTETSFISLHKEKCDLDRIQDIQKILNAHTFYFTWASGAKIKFDLTVCCQRLERAQNTDNRFFWNRMLFQHFKSFDVNTDKWLLKIMCGSVCINTVYVGHEQAKACLISRLSSERAGTRFNVRGTNDNGHVANFVETEQVIFLDNKVSSYILIRGSIPLFWEQTGVQVGAHKLNMSRGREISHPAFERHLANIQYLYGKQVIINLVGNKEGEFLIGSMYKSHHKISKFYNDIPYVAFDYHHQCSRGKEDNLILILKPKIEKYIDDFGFYYSLSNGNKQYQTGTFRVNCIDCLDRTNRVQTFLGLEMLKKQLKILEFDEKSTIVSRFFKVYQDMWQVNGDQISRLYAGTGALEGKSKLRDGTLSVARTFQNNLWDNSKQEAFDILLSGKPLIPDLNEKFRSLLPLNYQHLPSSLLLSTYERYFEYTSIYEIKVAVGTWNVNGGKHFNSIIYKKSDPLSDWLLDANKKNSNNINILDLSLDDSLTEITKDSPDLFAIGFEEIVDLSAQNIVAASTTNQKEWLAELSKTLSRNDNYVLVTCIQLVGVCLFLFVKPKYACFIRDVSTDQVKTGLGGATGNKGGVGIRLRLYNSTLCFICSHFAAGQSQVNERNSDFKEISRKMFSSIGKNIYSHDYVFWCGDFNYRIDLPINEVKQLINEKNFEQLLEKDQLKCQQKEGKVFRNYLEGNIDFAPTYKYDINSMDYDTSEKSRIPAWTDRILFRKFKPTRLSEKENNQLDYGKIVFYGRAELKTSDHRPVIGEYKVELLQVDNEKFSQVFRDVVEKAGPPDATVIIKELGNEKDRIEGKYLDELLKILNENIGPIVLAQFGEDHLRITFKDGLMALKLAKLNTINILNKTFVISLKIPDWNKLIDEEISYGNSNTVPLVQDAIQFNIDDYFEVPKVISPDSQEEVVEVFANTGDVTIPTRPPPPRKYNGDDKANGKEMEQRTNKPVRPAPPPPPSLKKTNELPNSKTPSLEEILNGPVNGSDIVVLNQEADNEDDYDEEGEEEMSNYTVPQIPAPNLPPPNIPAPNAPIDKHSNIPTGQMAPSTMPPLPPPPIPRRTVPAIPPRNN